MPHKPFEKGLTENFRQLQVWADRFVGPNVCFGRFVADEAGGSIISWQLIRGLFCFVADNRQVVSFRGG
jgi:hypothetical protein